MYHEFRRGDVAQTERGLMRYSIYQKHDSTVLPATTVYKPEKEENGSDMYHEPKFHIHINVQGKRGLAAKLHSKVKPGLDLAQCRTGPAGRGENPLGLKHSRPPEIHCTLSAMYNIDHKHKTSDYFPVMCTVKFPSKIQCSKVHTSDCKVVKIALNSNFPRKFTYRPILILKILP